MRTDVETAQSFIDAMESPGAFAKLCAAHWREAEQGLDKGVDHTAMYAHVNPAR